MAHIYEEIQSGNTLTTNLLSVATLNNMKIGDLITVSGPSATVTSVSFRTGASNNILVTDSSTATHLKWKGLNSVIGFTSSGQILTSGKNGALTVLQQGSSGQILYVNGSGIPAWTNPFSQDLFAYTYHQSSSTISTTSTTFVTAMTMNTPSLTFTNTYRVGWYYEWEYSTNTQTGTDGFRAQITFGSTATILMNQYQEPHYATVDNIPTYGASILTSVSGINTITLQYCTGAAGQTSTIGRRMIEFWRVS